jgi:HlyD family secretion protein
MSQMRHGRAIGVSSNEHMKKRLLLMLAALSIVSVSAAAYYRSNKTDGGPHLVTAPVTRGDVVETVQATGTLQAVTTVQVGTQVSGTIKTLKADFNSEVRRGQVVAELDPSLFQTQVDQAQATVVRLQSEVAKAKVDLADAELKLKRAVELKARQLIPETDYETAQTTANSAQAAVRSAEAQVVQAIASLKQNQVNLDHTIITAPIDGIVISRDVDVGQTVAASMQAPVLFTIAKDLTQMQVSASIDESDIGRIATGQTVTFRVDAYPTETFTGTVAQVRLQPVIDQNVVSYATVIDVPNPEMKLKPGMTATVTVQVARNDAVLRVPSAALSFRPTAEVLAAYGRQAPEQQAENAQASSEGPQRTSARQGRSANSAQGTSSNSAQERRSDSNLGASERRGARVWVMADGQLTPVRVQTGVTDGTTTAIVGGELAETAEVVTGVANSAATTATPSTGSPFLPFGNRNRQGGGAARTGAGR